MILHEAAVSFKNASDEVLFELDITEAKVALEAFEEKNPDWQVQLEAMQSWLVEKKNVTLSISQVWQVVNTILNEWIALQKKVAGTPASPTGSS